MKKGSSKWRSWLVLALVLCSAVVCAAVVGLDGLLVFSMLGSIVVGSLSVLIMLYFIRPRRGVHYAYWNRYLLVFGTWLVLLFGGFVLIGYVYVEFDILSEAAMGSLLAVWVVGVGPGILPWFKFVFLPAWGLWRLQGRYPEMVATARRLKPRGASFGYAWFMPLIVVQSQPYLLAGYGSQPMPPFPVLATLNADGRFVTDERLVETLMRGYKLALLVLHSETSLFRAREIERLKSLRRRLQRGFASLRANAAYFREAGGEPGELWQRLADFAPAAETLLANRVERGMWLAGWAKAHGLNKLTEIRDDQLHEVERRLAAFDAALAGCQELLEQIGADAATLQGSLVILADPLTSMQGERIRLQQRRRLKTLLQRLTEFCREAAAWQLPVDDFRPTEGDWRAWRAGKSSAERDRWELTRFSSR